jgi:hypothetical protein
VKPELNQKFETTYWAFPIILRVKLVQYKVVFPFHMSIIK